MRGRRIGGGTATRSDRWWWRGSVNFAEDWQMHPTRNLFQIWADNQNQGNHSDGDHSSLNQIHP